MKQRRFRRRLILITLLSGVVAIEAVNYCVSVFGRPYIYSDIRLLPHRKTGLLLGAPKYRDGQNISQYYQYRIDAAAALFKAGKIDYILVSGDSTTKEYHQPQSMRADLIAQGVPASRIVLDNAGFRTLDSILRCRDVFGEDSITVISQCFHNERALCIAAMHGVHAIAYNARDATGPDYREVLRERGARVKMLIDFLTRKGARVYGPKVRIGD